MIYTIFLGFDIKLWLICWRFGSFCLLSASLISIVFDLNDILTHDIIYYRLLKPECILMFFSVRLSQITK